MKSKNLNVIILSIFCMFFLLSCGSESMIMNKVTYIKSYEKFITEVKEDGRDFTKEDWQTKDETYKKYSRELYDKYEDDLTEAEVNQILDFNNQYRISRAKVVGKNVLQDIEDGILDAIDNIGN